MSVLEAVDLVSLLSILVVVAKVVCLWSVVMLDEGGYLCKCKSFIGDRS